jgi:hypothetical protein
MRRLALLGSAAALCALLAPACGGSGDSGLGSTVLGDRHLGWRDPACWSCHAPERTHHTGEDPHTCVPCHGTNGSGPGHTELTPCSTCHERSHGADGFPDPESCLTCHPVE